VQPGSKIQGKSEWKQYGDGTCRFKFSLRNVPLPDGSRIELRLDGQPLMKLTVKNGTARVDLEDEGGVGIPAVKAGQVLQIKSGASLLAEGQYQAE
jgi:hypothetical protein